MSLGSRPLSCTSLAVRPESSLHFTPLYSPSFNEESPSPHSHSSSSSSFEASTCSNFTDYYYQPRQHNNRMMAATLDGNSLSMMKLYSSNSKDSNGFVEQQNNGWNNSYSVGNMKVPAYQQQQQQPQQFQQLDQINFLVRKECCSEIDQAVSELGISADPFNWSVSDVQKWLLWMQRWVQLPALKLELFAMDGMALCSLSEEDFGARVANGEKLYAKLEIWRMAINYFKPEALFDTLFGNAEEADGVGDNNQDQYCSPSPYSADNCSIYSSSSSSPIRSPENGSYGHSGSSLPSYAESMYGGQCSLGSLETSPASPASSSHSSVNSCAPYAVQYGGGNGQQAFGQQQQMYNNNTKAIQVNDFASLNNTGAMMNSGAQRMVATSDYGSDAIPSDDDDMSDDEKCNFNFDYHRVSNQQQHILQLQQQQQLMLQQQQQCRSLPVSQIKVESTSDYPSSVSPNYGQQVHHFQQQQQHQQLMQQHFGAHLSHPRAAVHQQQQMYAHQQSMNNQLHHQSISVKSENISSSPSTTTPISAVPVAISTPTGPPARTTSSHIHLWQFLKELLNGPQTYGSSIRWLDRSKGVFKIEDSVRVAKLWGARKNRPAMNYDKLSRSIRQYYKKGIMKKTERSQRLVYQFCVPYAH